MVNLPDPKPDPKKGCPDWCQEIGNHTTHHGRFSKITVAGGARPLGIRLALMLPSRYPRPRIEMMIYRGANQVMRFAMGMLAADAVARELTKVVLVARTVSGGEGADR